MKITSIEAHPAGSSEIMVMSFKDVSRENPYIIKTIIGLDPDEIEALYSGVEDFYDLFLVKREPVFRVELNPNFSENQTYSDLRDTFYRMIQSSRTGKIQFQFKNEDEVVAVLNGSVSRVEAPQFQKDQPLQFTVKCDEPLLKAPSATVIDISGLDPTSTDILDDKSTARHGFKFQVEVLSNIPDFIIENPDDESWSFEIDLLGGFLTDDVIHFSSEYNNKYLYVVRDGDPFHLGHAIRPGSAWPLIFPKDNFFSMAHPDSLAWLAISHYYTYWGV